MKHLTVPFRVWLEKEYPSHSKYDFETIGAYDSWRNGLFKAYTAGYDFHRIEVEAGM